MAWRNQAPLPRPSDCRAGAKATADGREVTPGDVVGVAREVFRRELPVTGDHPLVHSSDHLNAALTPIKERVQVPGHSTEVVTQRRRLRVKGRKEQPFVVVELCHWH